MNNLTVGLDVGGTRIKAVAIDGSGTIVYQHDQPTDDGDDVKWKSSVLSSVKIVEEQINERDFLIGISAPGLPNQDNSAIAFMPGRLQGLENLVWTNFLHKKTYVLNDAVSALMAEARFGIAKDKKNVVMLTLGTGVGGAILIEGKPYQGAFNKAGHIGHMVIDSDGDTDLIGMPGSLELAIGNCSIQSRSSDKFQSTHQLLEACRNGDSFAISVWMTSVEKLAIGMASLTNILSPEMIILGGGITEAGNDLFDPLEKFMSKYEWRTGGNKTEIVKAQYGNYSGAVGAACFAMETFK